MLHSKPLHAIFLAIHKKFESTTLCYTCYNKNITRCVHFRRCYSLGNFSCNLFHNKIAKQIQRKITFKGYIFLKYWSLLYVPAPEQETASWGRMKNSARNLVCYQGGLSSKVQGSDLVSSEHRQLFSWDEEVTSMLNEGSLPTRSWVSWALSNWPINKNIYLVSLGLVHETCASTMWLCIHYTNLQIQVFLGILCLGSCIIILICSLVILSCRRRCGRVVKALGLWSGVPGLKPSALPLTWFICSCPEFNSLAMLCK